MNENYMAEGVLKKALDDLVSQEGKALLDKKFKKLSEQKGRRAGERRAAIRNRLKWDEDAREFFLDGEYEFWADLSGVNTDVIFKEYATVAGAGV